MICRSCPPVMDWSLPSPWTENDQISLRWWRSQIFNHIYSCSLYPPGLVLTRLNKICPDILKIVKVPTLKRCIFLILVSKGIKWYVGHVTRILSLPPKTECAQISCKPLGSPPLNHVCRTRWIAASLLLFDICSKRHFVLQWLDFVMEQLHTFYNEEVRILVNWKKWKFCVVKCQYPNSYGMKIVIFHNITYTLPSTKYMNDIKFNYK